MRILCRERYQPFNKGPRRPAEYLLRLSNTQTEAILNRWWSARTELRPVTQVLAGLLYQPGYVESNLISVAAALERFTKTRYPPVRAPRLTPQQTQPIASVLNALTGLDNDQVSFVKDMINQARRTPYGEFLQAILDDLGASILREARINSAEWKNHLLWARNDIAHEGAPNEQQEERYVTGPESRAARDGGRMVLSLAVLKYLGVADEALQLAAQRLGVRYGPRHTATTPFLN